MDCPTCGSPFSAPRPPRAARVGQERVTCGECGERIFVVAGNASRIIKVVCPNCGDFAPANKLDREGCAVVRCKACWDQIAITTDRGGHVIGIEPFIEMVQEPRRGRRWGRGEVIGILLIFLLIAVFFLMRNF